MILSYLSVYNQRIHFVYVQVGLNEYKCSLSTMYRQVM